MTLKLGMIVDMPRRKVIAPPTAMEVEVKALEMSRRKVVASPTTMKAEVKAVVKAVEMLRRKVTAPPTTMKAEVKAAQSSKERIGEDSPTKSVRSQRRCSLALITSA